MTFYVGFPHPGLWTLKGPCAPKKEVVGSLRVGSNGSNITNKPRTKLLKGGASRHIGKPCFVLFFGKCCLYLADGHDS